MISTRILAHCAFASLLGMLALPAARADATPAFDQLWTTAAQQHANAETHAYLQGLRPYATWRDGGAVRMLTLPHDKALLECVTAIFPAPSPVRMVFRLSKAGAVEEAHADQSGYVSECLASKVVGLRLPAPPHEGFLLCHHFERDGERSTVAPCGPAGWTEQCEQVGTTKRCRNEFNPR